MAEFRLAAITALEHTPATSRDRRRPATAPCKSCERFRPDHEGTGLCYACWQKQGTSGEPKNPPPAAIEGPRHGSARYEQGCRCDECKAAKIRRATAWKERVRQGPTPPGVHGTVGGYGHYGCRCDKCRAARTAAAADYRQRKAAAR